MARRKRRNGRKSWIGSSRLPVWKSSLLHLLHGNSARSPALHRATGDGSSSRTCETPKTAHGAHLLGETFWRIMMRTIALILLLFGGLATVTGVARGQAF